MVITEKITIDKNCHFGSELEDFEALGLQFEFEDDKPRYMCLPPGWSSIEQDIGCLIYNTKNECQCLIVQAGDLVPQSIFK